MRIFLVDGTYELFRHFFGAPPHANSSGREVAAVRGVLSSVLALVEAGASHVGVATDHVIESFRNDMWPGYKTGEGVDPSLLSQFQLLEDSLRAMGVVVWPMVDLEADDALASAARVAAEDPGVDQVVICTPDKDLGQCVSGGRVVQLDRRPRRGHRRTGGRREVRCLPRLDSRLPGAGGRQRRRVSGPRGVGCQEHRRGAVPLRSPGIDPRRPWKVGGTDPGRRRPGRHARRGSGTGLPLPRSGDPAD